MFVGAPFIKKKGNTRGEQTMLYFKRVAIFMRKLYKNKSVSDALGILLFLYDNFVKTKCFLSKWIHACNFVQVLKGS